MNYLEIRNLISLPSEVEEAVNRLHVNLVFCGTEYKKIVITSSIPDEGKSTISLHLWKKLAESGKRVVYIDADLRKSIIRSRYKIVTSDIAPKGLSHYLSGQASVEEVFYKTNIENGFMIPVTRNMQNPALLFHSDYFNTMLEALSDAFDYIIIDTPPLNAVSDGEMIASKADGVLLVVRSGYTRRKLISDSLNQIERANCRLLGVVLNRTKMGKGQYYRPYRYGYYSSYSSYTKHE